VAVIGLIAGNGSLPGLFARAARARGLEVVAVAHLGETEASLAGEVDTLTWVRVGQVARMQRLLLKAGVKEAVLAGGFRRMRVECADGYQQLPAVLPSRERRCLLLIDPPYENTSAELDQAMQNILSSLQRLANTVVLMWYPIKDERTVTPWLARVERALSAPALSLELWIYPRDSRVGLNGSGLLLVNPPYQFDQRAALWQQELHAVLDKGQQGGSALQWLVRASDVDHAGA